MYSKLELRMYAVNIVMYKHGDIFEFQAVQSDLESPLGRYPGPHPFSEPETRSLYFAYKRKRVFARIAIAVEVLLIWRGFFRK
jgi:hypothetical protein